MSAAPASGARRIGAAALAFAACLPLALGLAGPDISAGQGAGDERPNFVVVMTDDQRTDDMRPMKALRSHVKRRGTTFRNAFATFPLCCPSRATFLTGQYAHNHGVKANSGENGGYPAFVPQQDETIAVALREDGYRTGFIGKYLNGYPTAGKRDPEGSIPPGWSSWQAALDNRMYDWRLNADGRVVEFGAEERDYQTDVYARKANAFIRRSAAGPRPFFLTVATLAPHVENGVQRARNPRPARRHRDAYENLEFPTRPAFNERDVSDKPSFIPRTPLSRDAKRRIERRYRDRLASLLAVDDLIASVSDTLRAQGEARDTYVIFTSDNGYLQGEHRARKKFLLYEESANVPLMMRGPDLPRDARIDAIAANIDVAPTILRAAGVAPLDTVDGIDLVDFAQDPDGDRSILLDNALSNAVREPGWVYSEHNTNPDKPGPEEFELYDLEADPFQLENRYEDSFDPQGPDFVELSQRREALEDRLRELMGCQGSSCR